MRDETCIKEIMVCFFVVVFSRKCFDSEQRARNCSKILLLYFDSSTTPIKGFSMLTDSLEYFKLCRIAM